MAEDMLSVVTPRYSDPSAYQLSSVSRPKITDATDVIIHVYAASINPIDVKKAAGALKLALQDDFPFKIGYDCAGIVSEVGSAVESLKVGDSVYTRLPESHRGSWSEYAKCPERYIALKPEELSFEEAASLPLASVTALQALRKYKGSLEGKTVFIPAGLSGTGAYACQLAKNVFKAGTVITTVSTSKVDKVAEYLSEGIVDRIIDYTKDDPLKVIEPGSLDFVFDTTGQAMEFLSLMKRTTGVIISVSTSPAGSVLQNSNQMARPDKPRLPWVIRGVLDLTDAIRRLRAWRWSVTYEYFFLEPNAADLVIIREAVKEGKLRPVVGAKASFHDIEAVKEVCWQTYRGKGGLGKTVLVMKEDK